VQRAATCDVLLHVQHSTLCSTAFVFCLFDVILSLVKCAAYCILAYEARLHNLLELNSGCQKLLVMSMQQGQGTYQKSLSFG